MSTTAGFLKSHQDSTFGPRMLLLCPSPPDAKEFTFNYVCSHNSKVFDILLSPNTLSGYDTVGGIEAEYLRKLEEVGCCDGDDPDDIMKMLDEARRVEKDIEVEIIKACRPTIQHLAPYAEALPEIGSLHKYMYPETINLQLVTMKGALQAVRRDDLPIRDFHPPATDTKVFEVGLPYYKTSEILVLGEFYPSVLKVSIKDQVLCCKLTRITGHDSIYDEFRTLLDIDKASFNPPVKVPHPRGVIISHTGVVGFLMDYIPSLGRNLADAIDSFREMGFVEPGECSDMPASVQTITMAMKEKWAGQIEQTLQALHSRNVVWGDAKLSNILIDSVDQDAWIVDFGGGNTYGWVDRELQGTVVGDLQALEKIKTELAKE